MAYRKLRDTDLVRIIKINHSCHGMNAVVLDAQMSKSYVQVNHFDDGCECLWISNKHLIVRDSKDNFIVDGQVDHEAKRLYEEQRAQRFKGRNDTEVEFDNDPECEYDGWDREELIERIKELEEQIEYNS